MKAYVVILLVSVCLLPACDGRPDKSSEEKVTVSEILLSPPPPGEKEKVLAKPGYSNQKDAGKKIIKEGELRFETKNVAGTRTSINNYLQKLSGYIAVENQTNNGNELHKEYFLSTRVPANNFEHFLSFVTSGADRVDVKNIRIRDVTTEYIDVNAQVANKKVLEARYLELLKKGTKISDLLAIENKVAEIRTDIEATQGKLNYLVNQTEYSSLEITFYAKQSINENRQTFGHKLTNALASGGEILGTMFFGFLSLWPLWIFLGIGIVITNAWRKKYVKKTVE